MHVFDDFHSLIICSAVLAQPLCKGQYDLPAAQTSGLKHILVTHPSERSNKNISKCLPHQHLAKQQDRMRRDLTACGHNPSIAVRYMVMTCVTWRGVPVMMIMLQHSAKRQRPPAGLKCDRQMQGPNSNLQAANGAASVQKHQKHLTCDCRQHNQRMTSQTASGSNSCRKHADWNQVQW